MHVSPAKHSSASVTDGRTDDGQSDPYVSLCFAGDEKIKRKIEFIISNQISVSLYNWKIIEFIVLSILSLLNCNKP